LQQSNDGQRKTGECRSYQGSYGNVFAALLCFLAAFLFGVIAFRLIRHYIDFGGNLAIYFGDVLVRVCGGGACLVCCLINLLFPIFWEHDLTSGDRRPKMSGFCRLSYRT